jgi:hypothetical protein
MLIRAIALGIALLVGVGIMIPLMTDYSEAGPKHNRGQKKRSWKVKKYSKKWWALYRRQEQRRKGMIARRRALRAQQILAARQNDTQSENISQTQSSTADNFKPVRQESAAILPSGQPAPQNWKSTQVTSSALQYRLNDETGNQMGSASLSVVGTAGTESGIKTLGGVSISALRRTVIDKMIREDGWVVNDYQKDLNGKRVYVVVAQSPMNGGVQSRLFYFTEVDGRIYSLATAAPGNSQERLAQESERVINSLQRSNRSVEAGLR